MGFVSASVGGVIYLNWLRRKGIYQGEMGSDVQEEISLSTFAGENEVPLTESMDKFTIQLALVFIAYALAFLCMRLFNLLLDPTGQGATGYCRYYPEHHLGIPVFVQLRICPADPGGYEIPAPEGRHPPGVYQHLYAKPHRRIHV